MHNLLNLHLSSDDFGCILLELPDLFQISHYIASTELLFAQSELISDDVEVRKASLLLVEALYKLCKCLSVEDIEQVSIKKISKKKSS